VESSSTIIFTRTFVKAGVEGTPNINTKSAKEVLERRKHNDKSVVTSANVFDRLRNLDVKEICRLGS
jgi:hypothetical protein